MSRPDLDENVNYLIDSANPTGYAQVIEERDGGGTVLKSYAIGDDVLCQSVRTKVADSQLPTGTANCQLPSYFLYDGHCSTRQLADAQGGVTAQYAYDSYGVMLGQTAGAQQAQATSLLYSGERFDPHLQQYYLRARHYNQANGQFTSLDPYSGSPHDPQSLHKYAYCHNDPVNAVDPSGEMSIGEANFAVYWYAMSFMMAHPVWSTALSFAVSIVFGEYFEGIPPGTPGPFDEMARIHAGMNRVVNAGLTSVQHVRSWRAIPKEHYKGDMRNFFYSLYHNSSGRYNEFYNATYSSSLKRTVKAELDAYAKRGPGFRLVAKDNVMAHISSCGRALDLRGFKGTGL